MNRFAIMTAVKEEIREAQPKVVAERIRFSDIPREGEK
jgi:hypothetical protein